MRIAIWGSCATRDCLTGRDHPFDDIQYFARSSWITQAAPTPALDVEFGPGLAGKFGERMVVEDIGRLITSRLVDSSPDVVVFDLIDERFDVVDAGEGAWVTDSDYFSQTPTSRTLKDAGARQVARFDDAREQLFADSVGTVANGLRDLKPTVPLVLHTAWHTPFTVDPAVQMWASAPQATARANRQLARLYELVARALPRPPIVAAPPQELLRADPAHQWGLAPYHYESAYYDVLLEVVSAVASEDSHPAAHTFDGRIEPPAHIEQHFIAWQAARETPEAHQ